MSNTQQNADGGQEDYSAYLANLAVNIKYEDLSPGAVRAAKWGILDTLGVCLGATGGSANYLDPFRKYLDAAVGPGNVPAPNLGKTMPPLDVILWLGALAHTLDFDDVAGYSHPSGPVVTAALPVAYNEGKVDGKKLIVAVALGQDLVIRLAQAIPRPLSHYGWLPSMPGILGAALTTASLLQLDEKQTRNALGLALHQTSGTLQALARPGSAYRAVREGFNARSGALSALLAREGLPGDGESIEGQYGYFQQFCRGEYDAGFLRSKELLGETTSFKYWPAAGHPLLFLTALLGPLEAGKLDLDHVAAIRLTGCSDLLPHQCVPIEVRAAPTRSIDAKVSIPFLIGKLLTHGNVVIQDFTPEGLKDAKAIALGEKVTHTLDASCVRGSNGFGLGIVEVEHDDGRIVRCESEYPLGHPDNPMTWQQIVDKFHACLGVSETNFSKETADAMVEAVGELEGLPDVKVLLELAFQGTKR